MKTKKKNKSNKQVIWLFHPLVYMETDGQIDMKFSPKMEPLHNVNRLHLVDNIDHDVDLLMILE